MKVYGKPTPINHAHSTEQSLATLNISSQAETPFRDESVGVALQLSSWAFCQILRCGQEFVTVSHLCADIYRYFATEANGSQWRGVKVASFSSKSGIS